MKCLILIFFCTTGLFYYSCSQNLHQTKTIKKKEVLNYFNFTKNHIYIICRGTKSNSTLISRSFSIYDSNATHVGIGILENKKIKIYSVTTEKKDSSKTYFLEDDLISFISNDDVYYLSVWQTKATSSELKRLNDFINETKNQKITYDYKFTIKDDDTLYCSEFCVYMLKYIDNKKFDFSPTVKEIKNNFLAKILGRNLLYYYPVDFFIKNKFIAPVNTFFLISTF